MNYLIVSLLVMFSFIVRKIGAYTRTGFKNGLLLLPANAGSLGAKICLQRAELSSTVHNIDWRSGSNPKNVMMIIKNAAKEKDYSVVEEVWKAMQEGEIKPLKQQELLVMASTCHKAEHTELLQQIRAELASRDLPIHSQERFLVSLVRCYADDHRIDEAMHVIDEDIVCAPKLRTFVPILASFAARGALVNMCDTLDKIMSYGLDLNEEVLEVVLRGWATALARGKSSENEIDASRARLNDFFDTVKNDVLGLDHAKMYRVLHAFTHGSFGCDATEVESTSVLVRHKGVVKGTVVAEDESNVVTMKPARAREPHEVQRVKKLRTLQGVDSHDEEDVRRVVYQIQPDDVAGTGSGSGGDVATARMVAVDEATCTCPNCGEKLLRSSLSEQEREMLRASLNETVQIGNKRASQPRTASKQAKVKEKRLEEFSRFQNFLRRKKVEYTHIVDGANVAYSNQNNEDGQFRYRQIAAVVRKIEMESSQAKILVIVPRIYMQNVFPNKVKGGSARSAGGELSRPLSYLSDDDRAVLSRLSEKDQLYSVPPSSNDDLFWIYAAVQDSRKGAPAVIVTNDKMRDHCFEFMEARPLWRLNAGQVCNFDLFDMITGEPGATPDELAARVKLIYPAPFSREMQTQGSGSSARRWHVPQSDDDHLWLCVQAP